VILIASGGLFLNLHLVAMERPFKSLAYFFLAALYRLALAAWAFLMFASRALVWAAVGFFFSVTLARALPAD
jgi:hypothetical protein